jgi:hypothetical protein
MPEQDELDLSAPDAAATAALNAGATSYVVKVEVRDGRAVPIGKPRVTRQRATWQSSYRVAEPPAQTATTLPRLGRAPRLATNTRVRGSRRTSSSSRGSPGDDDPGGSDEPASRGRRHELRPLRRGS